MDRYIFYIGDFKANKHDAQFQLVYGNGLILRELGYKVIFIGNDNSIAKNDIIQSYMKIGEFDIYNISFNKSIKDIFKIIKIKNDINKVISKYNSVKYIINYGSPSFAIELSFLHKLCKKKKIKFISNCVDLSSINHGTSFQRIFKNFDINYRRKIIQKYSDGIIGVSTYIVNYYKQYNHCSNIIIPPLKEKNNSDIDVSDDNNIKIVYIGEPFPTDGRKVDESAYKDRLDLFIDLISIVNSKNRKLFLDIYGLSKNQYLSVVTRHQKMLSENDRIVFHGRVKHEELQKQLGIYDFSVVFREKNRMTMAGFSSKLVESICNGIPVILTDTSDYSYYLEDGVNCFFIDERMNDSTVKKMLKISKMKKLDILEMKKNCLKYNRFNYKFYVEKLSDFLHDIEKK